MGIDFSDISLDLYPGLFRFEGQVKPATFIGLRDLLNEFYEFKQQTKDGVAYLY